MSLDKVDMQADLLKSQVFFISFCLNWKLSLYMTKLYGYDRMTMV